MKRLFSAGLTGILTALASAPGAYADEHVSTFMLSNGMEGVVIRDARAPVAVNMVWYRAGAADEPPGKSGIAHFLEHLMFKGTDELGAGEFSKIVAANGGSDNAFTSWDYTGYFQRVAADRLELMIRMEADRMTDLQLTDEDAVTERDVILEERAQRTDSSPGGLFAEERRATQFYNHPYGIPIVGWRSEIEALNLADALDFYRLFYSPNNAVLVVAGDVDPAEIEALAEKYYGAIPANPDLKPRARPQEPPHRAERRVIFTDPRVAQPMLTRSYLAPERDPGDQEQAAALTILAELLGGNPATSFLGQRLQFDEQIALYTNAGYDGMSLDDTSFGLVVVPVEGVGLPEAEAALDRVVSEFIENDIDLDALDRIKQQLRASLIYAQDSLQGQAQLYGSALTSGLTVEDVQAWPEALDAVTAEDVKAAARAVLRKRQAVTGYYSAPAPGEDAAQSSADAAPAPAGTGAAPSEGGMPPPAAPEGAAQVSPDQPSSSHSSSEPVQ